MPSERLTPAECETHGGHCFVRTGFAHATPEPEYQEVCKHCPIVRWATAREPWAYRYEPPGRGDE